MQNTMVMGGRGGGNWENQVLKQINAERRKFYLKRGKTYLSGV